MPKKTFNNLKQEKRDRFIEAFLKEFTVRRYDEASISAVLKSLGLAKGSFYQYFEHKRDLFDYLVGICFQQQQVYIQQIRRDDHDSFWSYWRATYEKEVEFDQAYPLMSNFNYCLTENLNSPSLQLLYNQWYKHGHAVLKSMVEKEVRAGHFRSDIPADTIATFLMDIRRQIIDTFKLHDASALEKNRMNGTPIVSEENTSFFFQIIDDRLLLLSAAIDRS